MVMKLHSAIAFGFTLILTLFLLDCAHRMNGSLQSQVERWYRAEEKHDCGTMWSMVVPELKANSPYEEFADQFREGSEGSRILSWKIERIEIRDSYTNDIGEAIPKRAKVAMDVTIQYKDKKEPEKATDQTDYWVLINGRWYWYWRGWPSD